MDGDGGVEVHKDTKKDQGQYPAIFSEQASSIKDLLYDFRGTLSCGTQRVVPSGQSLQFFKYSVTDDDVRYTSKHVF